MNTFAFLPLLNATYETFYMVFIASFISILLGLGVGLLLFLTRKNQSLENKFIHQTLSFIVNVTRSVPFIILMISILPLTRFITGTTIGINAAIVPLTLAAIPFFARVCESAFGEISDDLIETANALGASTFQTVQKILLPESLSALIKGGTLTIINLIGYSAMAGAVGGGGLGELAINYGYQRFNAIVTLETVILLVIIVQAIQWAGDKLALKRKCKPVLLLSIFLSLILICFVPPLIANQNNAEKTITVGVMTGWPEDVMKVAQQVAWKRYHLQLRIVTFDDYVLPNTALENGNIDANIFQHVPYLDAQIKARHYALTPIAKTFVYPMGFYSRKITQISQLKTGAIIALPNDPSNESRALLLLQKSGLIALKPNVGVLADINDIVSNPNNLHFKLLDSAQLPRVLQDADLVALTNDFVGAAGFTIHQAIIKEGADSPYANVIVVKTKDKNNPLFQELITVMHSDEVLKATQKIFPDGAAIAAW